MHRRATTVDKPAAATGTKALLSTQPIVTDAVAVGPAMGLAPPTAAAAGGRPPPMLRGLTQQRHLGGPAAAAARPRHRDKDTELSDGHARRQDGTSSNAAAMLRRGSVKAPSLGFSFTHQPREPLIQYENTFRMCPPARHPDSSVIRRILDKLLGDSLVGATDYNAKRCAQKSKELSATALARLKELGLKRYKFVVIVTLGSVGPDPSTLIGSRCLWMPTTDTQTTAMFIGKSIYAVAVAYSVYFE